MSTKRESTGEAATESDGLEARIAARLRERREALELSLDALAARSGVSRAMISRVERGESSPTAGLLGKLCNGLGLTLSGLMAEAEPAPHAVRRAAEQPRWQDPETGYVRRMVSPPATGSAVEVVAVELPRGARVAYDPSARLAYDQHVLLMEGRLRLAIGGEPVELHPGDCAHMTLDAGLAFENPGRITARYLVIVHHQERTTASRR